jgi:hypothetical protein
MSYVPPPPGSPPPGVPPGQPPPGVPPGQPPGGGGYPPPGAPGWNQQPGGPKPDNYLVWSILTTIFCCLPFGIVSIVYAAKVDGLYNGGDYAGARLASDSAKKWAIIAGIAGLLVASLYSIFFFVIAAGSDISGY